MTVEEFEKANEADRRLVCRGMERLKNGQRVGVVVGGEPFVQETRELGGIAPTSVRVTDLFHKWAQDRGLVLRWWCGDAIPHRAFVEGIDDDDLVELKLRFL